MVHIASLISVVAVFTSAVLAIPVPDSAINEPAVSAVDGQLRTESVSATVQTMAPKETGGSQYGGNSNMQYGSNSGGMQYGSSSSSSEMSKMNTKTSTKKSTETMMSEPMMTKASTKKGTETMMSEPMMTKATSTKNSMPTYGSGSSGWNSSPYDDCVQQCMNKYAPPPAKYTPPPTSTEGGKGSAGGVGTGATHTVIVAPTKGVLRYVPFAVNASVGDTVLYRWGAGPHTVTMGSTLEICNKSASENTFASGMQNAGFEFSVVINDTKPMFVYCAVPTHCQKGMFGVVNPPNAAPGSPSALNSMMQNWVQNSSSLAALNSDTNNKTMGNSAYSWGSMFDVSQFPEDAHVALAENVLMTRQTLALNEGMQKANSAVRSDGQPLTLPAVLLTGTAVTGGAYGDNGPVAGTPPADNTPTSTPAPASSPAPTAKNGAGSIAASSVVVAIVALFASFMAL